MNVLFVLGVALALAMDAFAVAVGLSLAGDGLRGAQSLRLAFHFGLFQFMMPIAGWAAGQTVIKLIAAYDHWIAAGLLVFVGGKMIVESFHKEERIERKPPDVTRGFSLILLSVATSLDALAVGLSFGALRVPILLPAAVIGVVCFTVTLAGTKIGPLLGKLAGKWAEIAGGIVLLLIAVKILVDHL
ncbi:MAG: manganese efflux pump MntP family protein [Candidatus Aminicenantes bacterium]|nr:manganese efflux pump MntP family protein [Candidatus Aminicenantes bacterium]